MKAGKLFALVAVLFCSGMPGRSEVVIDRNFVTVTDYVKAGTGKDVSDEIQKIIDDNPNRTIWFPDGEYIIGKPILTPADPEKSVALELSNYAVIRASKDWTSDEAMIRLGASHPANNVRKAGSNYYLSGGVIDGNGVASAISIDGGRETQVRDCSIKGARTGLHIKYGANGGSSDCDISNINIIGNYTRESVGILVESYDNTFTNIRIGGVTTGVLLKGGGNYLRNIHPLFHNAAEYYQDSVGFISECDDNWFDFCYSDQFATGFLLSGCHDILLNCFVYWYSKSGERHTAIRSDKCFNASVSNITVGMGEHNAVKENIVLDVAEDGGDGFFSNPVIRTKEVLTDGNYLKYIRPQ